MADTHSLKLLTGVLSDAAAHHDPADARTFDLDKLTDKVVGNPEAARTLVGAAVSKPDILGLLLQLVAGLLAKKLEKPAPVPPPVVTAPGGPPAAPPRPQVTGVELKVASILGPARTGSQSVPYRLLEDGTIQLVGDTVSLDDKSTIWLDAGVSGPEGGLRIDLDPAATPAGQVNHPDLLGRVAFIAEDVATGEELGRIGGKGLDDLGHIDNGVSFVPQRYAESGGMAANARIKRKGGPIRIYAELGDVESNAFVTPEVR